MARALYPGTFDPITNGHLDIIRRGAQLFEAVDVVVAVNTRKASLFSIEERVDMVRACTGDLPGVTVLSHAGLMVECLRERGAQVLLRGLRAVSDFEHEFQMALMNKKLDPGCETVYLMPSEQYTYLASSLVRELAALGADISEFVPPEIETVLRRKLSGGKKDAVKFRPGSDSAMPAAVRVLLIVNVGIFLVDFLTRGRFLTPLLALDPWAVTRDFQAWRVFTYMFVHDFRGILHILFNMLMLWMFGVPVAREMGEGGFLRLYLMAGLFAGLCSLVFYGATGNPAIIVGASGAVYGLLVAFARFFPEQQLLMFFVFPVPVRYAVIIMGAISLLLVNSGDGIAHIAHLGGAVFAWVYLRWFWSPSRGGFLAQWRQRRNRNRWEKAMRDGERLRAAMEDIDPILRKISAQGLDALTRDERRRLDHVSGMKKKLHGTDLPISDYYKNR